MITEKTLTDWLFYRSPYSDYLDKGEYDDPKYLELNFPHRKDFCDKLVECSLPEFVSTLVWIFKDKFPVEYIFIQMFQLEEVEGKSTDYNTNNRKAQDIEPLEFFEHEKLIGYLNSLKITFKQPQEQVILWVEQALEGKEFEKIETEGITTYYDIKDSAIQKLEVTNTFVHIHIDKKKIDE